MLFPIVMLNLCWYSPEIIDSEDKSKSKTHKIFHSLQNQVLSSSSTDYNMEINLNRILLWMRFRF